MKTRSVKSTLAVAVLLGVPRAALACEWYNPFCSIPNLIKCGSVNCNSKPPAPAPPPPAAPPAPGPSFSQTPAPPAPPPPAPPPAAPSPTSDYAVTATPPAVNSAATAAPPSANSAALIVPTAVSPLPKANSSNNNNTSGADSTQLVKSGGATPTPSGSSAKPYIGGGDAPPVSGPSAQNTIDAPVAAHATVAANDLSAADAAKLASAGLDYSEAGARQGFVAQQAAAAEPGEAGVKAAMEMNIYKTVGAIPGAVQGKGVHELEQVQQQTLQNKLSLKDWDGVADAASAMLRADPANIRALVHRAEAFNHLARYAEAEHDAVEAVRHDPADAKAWKELAWAELRQGKFKEALDAASRAIALNPRDAEAYAMRAFARESLGDLTGRLADIAMAAALDSRFHDAYERAKTGERIYRADEEEETLLGVASPRPSGAPSAGLMRLLELLLFFMPLAAAAWVARRFLKKASVAAAAPARAEPAVLQVKKITTGSIIGKYQLGRLVGRGGMGQVFEATDLSLGRPVAVKKMTEQLAQLGPQSRGLFLKEARTVAQLHHPSIVEIYEIIEEGEDLFIVFELLNGKTAQQLLAEAGKLPLPRVVELLKPVCEALDFAHARALVHRDLKPGNVMVTAEGHVKLMDFGIARTVGDSVPVAAVPATTGAGTVGFARTSIVAGTVEYRAPEAEAGIVCKEGDVYSLGVTAYELLTGRLPYSPLASAEDKAAQRYARASALAPGLPPGIDALLGAALQSSPERRLKTPGEFFAGLAAL